MMLAIVNTIALVCLCLCTVLYINERVDRHTAGCERWGFVLTAAGAFGHAISYWWPWGGAEQVETILHIGVALVGFAMIRGDLRELVVRARRWDGHDRRGHDEFTT